MIANTPAADDNDDDNNNDDDDDCLVVWLVGFMSCQTLWGYFIPRSVSQLYTVQKCIFTIILNR